MRPYRSITLLVAALFLGACAKHPPVRRPIAMEHIPPPEPQQMSLAVGGGAVFETNKVIAVETDRPDTVRAYATEDALALIGEHAGKTTLTVHFRGGEIFNFNVEVTSDPPAQHARVVGEPFVITYDGVDEYTLSGKGLEARKSNDGTQLIVTSTTPGQAIVGLVMADGSIHRVELLIIGGQRLL